MNNESESIPLRLLCKIRGEMGEMALSRCWRLTATHSEIGDLRQQRSTPSIAETLGLEILSWCDGT